MWGSIEGGSLRFSLSPSKSWPLRFCPQTPHESHFDMSNSKLVNMNNPLPIYVTNSNFKIGHVPLKYPSSFITKALNRR